MSKKKKPIEDVELDEILKKASLLAEDAFPTTAEAVRKTEDQEVPPLPERLQNPEVAFNRALLKPSPAPSIEVVSAETQSNFRAMAARNGGEISEETRKLMDDDRNASEESLDEEIDG